MAFRSGLSLHEELVLLALRDERGTLSVDESVYQHAIAGALLAELLLEGRVTLEEVRRQQLVDVGNAKPLGDNLLDDCIARLLAAKGL